MSAIMIVLVDDHRVVSRSLKAFLESFPDLRVAGIAASGEELLERLAEWKPDVVVQDLLMPGGIDGVETIRRMTERAPAVKVIALTASVDEARMMGALRAAAWMAVCASSLPAQKSKTDTTRTLQGVVFDPDGNPVTQAVVQLKDSRTLQVISFITHEDGKYHFANLKQDTEYQVKADHSGMTSDWRRLSIFDTRKIAEMNLKVTKKEPAPKDAPPKEDPAK